MAILTDPRSLRSTLGREGWCQRLLTELILEAPYPPYNSQRRPSDRGLVFLGALDERCFGTDQVSMHDPVIVDEIDFPARHPDEQGCAPDYTVFTDDRCWIIELKTEPGSHLPRQIPSYFERARHYHPDRRIDITYLTAGLRRPFEPPTEPWERYAHVEWSQVMDLIASAWTSSPDPEIEDVAQLLLRGLEHLDDPIAAWWERLGYDVKPPVPSQTPAQAPLPARAILEADGADRTQPPALEDGLSVAEATGADGRQRALGLATGGLEALQELRLALHRACQEAPTSSALLHVQPWMWNATTSGGKAMTAAGQQTGYEVRISRSRTSAPDRDESPG